MCPEPVVVVGSHLTCNLSDSMGIRTKKYRGLV